jgi:hypothetical protein
MATKKRAHAKESVENAASQVPITCHSTHLIGRVGQDEIGGEHIASH